MCGHVPPAVLVTPTDPTELQAQTEMNYAQMWGDPDNRRHRKDYSLFVFLPLYLGLVMCLVHGSSSVGDRVLGVSGVFPSVVIHRCCYVRLHNLRRFQVDLDVKDGCVQLTTKLESYVERPLALFDQALSIIKDIPQLEMQVMEHLFLAGDQGRLAVPSRDEPWVCALYDKCAAALQSYAAPLQQYIELYSEFSEFIVR